MIYESLHVHKEDKKNQTFKASSYITIFMICVFYFMILMFGYTSHISMKYPKVHQCDKILHKFEDISDEILKQ